MTSRPNASGGHRGARPLPPEVCADRNGPESQRGGGRQTTRPIDELSLSPGHPIALRRQLAAQIGTAIRSGELGTGLRLPSGRRLADLLGLHRHTVLAAYAELARLGLVHRNQRSGVFVCPDAASSACGTSDPNGLRLEDEFAEFLRSQRGKGRSAADLNRLMSRWTDRSFERGIVVVEPEPALRRLIEVEIRDELPDVAVAGSSRCRARRRSKALSGRCVVARHEVAARLQGLDPAAVDLAVLRTASVRGCRFALRSLQPGQVATVLTASRLLRRFVRVLFAGELAEGVGLACPGLRRRSDVERALRVSDLVLTDSVTPVPRRPPGSEIPIRSVRILDHGWVRELARYMGVDHQRLKTGSFGGT